jgi:hypothetical protein
MQQTLLARTPIAVTGLLGWIMVGLSLPGLVQPAGPGRANR